MTVIDTLLAARHEHVAIDALPEMPADVEVAYAVQAKLVSRLGLPAIGWKIGCTSAMAQRISRVNEPFFGRMFAATTTASPTKIKLAKYFNPILEPEIAFRMARDLPAKGAPYDEAAVSEAVAAIFPAIEMVDSRYSKGWKIDIRETISDNGVHAFFVKGEEQTDWPVIDRPSIPLTVTTNGKLTADGIGSNALEDPMNALVWLANGLAQRGLSLSEGDLVTTGNICSEPIRPRAGEVIIAEFGTLGTVEVAFE